MSVELREANEKLQASILALERRNAEIALLSELYEAFQACRTAEEIYETAGRYAVMLFPGDAGALYVYKESRNLMVAMTVWGPGEQAAGVLVPDDCWALRRGKAHLADDPASSPVCPHVRSDNGAPPYICVPLSARGETLGLLHIRFLGGPVPGADRISQAKRGPAQSFAERVALALDNFRLREKLLQQSIRDPLTGLFNRRFMEETLGRELARAERKGTPLGVIMLDIDKFKDFNDTFGHEAGDEMLKAIGAFLPAQVRREDVVCRYGGEEFTIILPGASLEASAERAGKLLAAVRPLRVKTPARRPRPDHLFRGRRRVSRARRDGDGGRPGRRHGLAQGQKRGPRSYRCRRLAVRFRISPSSSNPRADRPCCRPGGSSIIHAERSRSRGNGAPGPQAMIRMRRTP